MTEYYRTKEPSVIIAAIESQKNTSYNKRLPARGVGTNPARDRAAQASGKIAAWI
jgi:hypothetical protein